MLLWMCVWLWMLATPCLIPCVCIFYLTRGNKDWLIDWSIDWSCISLSPQKPNDVSWETRTGEMLPSCDRSWACLVVGRPTLCTRVLCPLRRTTTTQPPSLSPPTTTTTMTMTATVDQCIVVLCKCNMRRRRRQKQQIDEEILKLGKPTIAR